MSIIFKSLSIMAILLTNLNPAYALHSTPPQELIEVKPVQKNTVPTLTSYTISTGLSAIAGGISIFLWVAEAPKKALVPSIIITAVFGTFAYKKSKNILTALKELKQRRDNDRQMEKPQILL